MAKAKLVLNPALDNYINTLAKLHDATDEMAANIVMSGANIVADEIRSTMNKLPEDEFRRLSKGEEFVGVPDVQLKDLQDSLGITPVKISYSGNTNVKVGFSGYGKYHSKKYPKGLPNALLARSIESGSSVRKKNPFVRPAINKSRKKAVDKMKKTYETEMKNYSL